MTYSQTRYWIILNSLCAMISQGWLFHLVNFNESSYETWMTLDTDTSRPDPRLNIDRQRLSSKNMKFVHVSIVHFKYYFNKVEDI